MTATIHVVDDDLSFRTALGRMLRSSGYDVILYESCEQLLQQLPKSEEQCCILLDVRIPGLSGPDLQSRLVSAGSQLPVIFLTGQGDIPTSVQAIKAGAQDFLTKPVSTDKLLAAIERALANQSAMRERSEHLQSLRSLVGKLTPREREVFELVTLGKLNKQIAFELGTAERTIKAHRQKVMEKMRVQSLAELVSIAERTGILEAAALSNHHADKHRVC